MTAPLVAAVVLNTNRREDTLACLESLQNQTYENLKVIVLDNACTDGSNEAIRAQFPQVEILSLAQNLGYAGNNNTGIRAALEGGAAWVFVVNEDILLEPNAVRCLIETAQPDPAVGIAGPMVYHADHPDVIQSAGGVLDARWQAFHRGQNQPEQGQFAAVEPVDWISGCAILVRRETIEQVGMLDERFFYYFEETEWCTRARRAGWKILFVPQSKIWHKGVQIDYRPGPNVTYYATRNRFLMMSKHRAPLLAWGYALTANFLRPLIAWTVKPRWKPMRLHRNAMWQGAADFFRKRWGMRSQPR